MSDKVEVRPEDLARAILRQIAGWQDRLAGIEHGAKFGKQYKEAQRLRHEQKGMAVAAWCVRCAMQECGVEITDKIDPLYEVEPF